MLATRLTAWADMGQAAALVEVIGVEGSAPRYRGAAMGVSATDVIGTIGGGALEAEAVRAARRMLDEGGTRLEIDQPLGPEIGQCCGGRVSLLIEAITPDALSAVRIREAAAAAGQPAVLVFGAGHTGNALSAALAPLPLSVRVIDQREDWLARLAPSATPVLTALPEAEVAAAPTGAAFVILTHDHALDFLIAEAALARGDATYVGMIGSTTKRAKLMADLARKGVGAERLTCPIGANGRGDKRPEVIAVATAAEIAAILL